MRGRQILNQYIPPEFLNSYYRSSCKNPNLLAQYFSASMEKNPEQWESGMQVNNLFGKNSPGKTC